MRSNMVEEVAAIMHEAATVALLPRFRKLAASEVEEKSPGEVVTAADREAEQLISPKLAKLLAGSRVVGEEAVAARPSLMEGLDEGHIWLVDPLDGTANFVAGLPTFAVMVALLEKGQALASWLLEPISGRLCTAVRSQGAFIDGARVWTPTKSLPAADCRRSVLTRFLPDDLKRRVAARSESVAEVRPGAKCAGVDYPSIIEGAQNFLMFWRLLPWDHAAGALLVTEAGGYVAHLDGTGYEPFDRRSGLLVSSSRDVWENVKAALLA